MRHFGTFILGMALIGCTGAVTGESGGTLELIEDEGLVTGAYSLEGEELTFRSELVDEGIVEVQVHLHGMVLDAVIDAEGNVSSLDGYAAEDGDETQVIEADRLLLAGFYGALNDYWPGNGMPAEQTLLRRSVSIWSQLSTSMELTRTVMGEEGRGYSMLCSYAYCGSWSGSCSYWNWYRYGDHDGWGHDNNDPESQQVVQLGNHYSCSGDVYYWTSNGWRCGEPDHWNRPYEVGNCDGRVGPGCGGDTQYTKDGTDHDGCVRNGHSTFSGWCSDEFTYAADDELFAPNCY